MRRGHRKLWRAVADSAEKVASSTNYAEEYVYGSEFSRALDDLLSAARVLHEGASTPTTAKRQSREKPAGRGGSETKQ